jgi:hypothetical protein
MDNPGLLRPLTAEELELLGWMFEHGSDDLRSFHPQIEGLRAARSCKCGCPAIRLDVRESASLGLERGERVVGDFEGKTARGELVGVLLFQRAGKLTELEVYSMDGQLKGESAEFGLPTIDSMNLLVWEPLPGHPNAWVAVKSPESPA